MIKSNKKFADVPVHIYEYLPLISPFLIPSASPLLTLVFPLLFFITLVSFPLFLLIFLNPFPSPLVFSPFCTSLHPSHSFSPSIHIHPLFHFPLPVTGTCFLILFLSPASSLSLLFTFSFPFSFPFLSVPFTYLPSLYSPSSSVFPVPLTLPLPYSSPFLTLRLFSPPCTYFLFLFF